MKNYTAILFLLLLLAGCKKDSAGTQNNANGSALPPYDYPNNADIACFVSIDKVRVAGMNGSTVRGLVYLLPATGQFNPLLTVDSLFLNSYKFSLNNQGSYSINEIITGSTPPATWNWSLYSNTRFGNLQFNMATSPADLSVVDLIPSDTIHRSGFIFSHSLIRADSVYYIIEDAASNLAIIKHIGNSTGVPFTASDMSLLTNSANGALFKIEAYRYRRMLINGHLVYFQNLSVATNYDVNIKN